MVPFPAHVAFFIVARFSFAFAFAVDLAFALALLPSPSWKESSPLSLCAKLQCLRSTVFTVTPLIRCQDAQLAVFLHSFSKTIDNHYQCVEPAAKVTQHLKLLLQQHAVRESSATFAPQMLAHTCKFDAQPSTHGLRWCVVTTPSN